MFTWFVVILRRYTHRQAQGVDGLEMTVRRLIFGIVPGYNASKIHRQEVVRLRHDCIPSVSKKEIDLALLGIEKWADDRAYFCTPRKAGIIGRDGVPGALCRHELYRYAGTAGRRYDPCGLRRRGSPQTGALRPGSAEGYFVCSRDRVYRRCGWPGIRFCWRGAGKTSDGLFLASFRRRMWNSG